MVARRAPLHLRGTACAAPAPHLPALASASRTSPALGYDSLITKSTHALFALSSCLAAPACAPASVHCNIPPVGRLEQPAPARVAADPHGGASPRSCQSARDIYYTSPLPAGAGRRTLHLSCDGPTATLTITSDPVSASGDELEAGEERYPLAVETFLRLWRLAVTRLQANDCAPGADARVVLQTSSTESASCPLGSAGWQPFVDALEQAMHVDEDYPWPFDAEYWKDEIVYFAPERR